MRIAAAGCCAALSLSLLAAQGPDLGLGRGIFERGLGRDGRPVGGRIAGGEVRMEGEAVACGNCHGARGGGGGEAWVNAPDIRWFALSKPFGARRAGGSPRPPYDRARFAHALRSGTASDGIALDPAMPRYDLADDEIDALAAYLARIGEDVPTAARPALVLLAPRAPTPAAERLLQGLQACPLSDGDASRPLPALRVVRYDVFDDIQATLGALAETGEAAALFAPYLIGAEERFAASGLGARLPVLLPMRLRESGPALFALPGLDAQARALVRAPERPGVDRLGIAIEPGLFGRDALAQGLRGLGEGMGWRVTLYDDAAAALADRPEALLALATLPAPPPGRSTLQLWVPAAYLTAPTLTAWTTQGARIRIALPYPPATGDGARWVPPADAWVAIGCELMARLPALPKASGQVGAWRQRLRTQPDLRLGDWLRLPAETPDPADAAARVHVSSWPPAGR